MPDTGLLEDPTRPAMYADTEQNRNPATTMITGHGEAHTDAAANAVTRRC